MKFHLPSFVLGAASATAVIGARAVLRPVAVELGAFGLHALRVARAVVERERERLEDLWADVEEAARRAVHEAEERAGAPSEPPPTTH